MATTIRPATEEDLLRTPRDGRKHELVDGQIRVSPAGFHRGAACIQLATLLKTFVTAGDLGHVADSSTGFRFPGGNIRAPDVRFVAKGRFPAERRPRGFADLVPDIAVEVLSPEDRWRDVLDKVGEYLQAGVRLVWVIDPEGRSAAVHRSPTDVSKLGPDDLLDGEDVLPGFRCRLADVIAE